MFWRFHEAPSASVNELLSHENATLEQLLDEDDVLQECKAQNTKVVEFLTRPDVLASLVSLLVTEPPSGDDPLSQFRHASLAAELVSCSIPAVLERLAADRDLLTTLTAPLRLQAPLNPLIASFMSRAISLLLLSRPQQLLEYLQSEESLLDQVLHHLGTSAIMDLLCCLASGIEQPDVQLEAQQWLHDRRLATRLASMVGDCDHPERQVNAASVLVSVTTCARQMALQLEEPRINPLMADLETAQFAGILLDAALSDTRTDIGLVQSVTVLLPLLETRPPRPPAPDEDAPVDDQPEPASVAGVTEAVLPRLSQLHAALVTPPARPDMVTSWGRLSPPLGATRLQMARLTAALVAANRHSVNCELARLGTVQVLLDLFFHFTLNNFLHSYVESCVARVLEAAPHTGEDAASQHPLLSHLFGQCRLVQRILDGMEPQDIDEEKGDQQRCRRSMRAYCGHLVNISNKVVSATEEGAAAELVKQQLSALPDDVRSAWADFKDHRLAHINEINRPVLPEPQRDSESESELRAVSELQQATILRLFSEGPAGALSESLARADDPFRQLSAAAAASLSGEPDDSATELFEQRCAERLSAPAMWPPREAGDGAPVENSSSDEEDEEEEEGVSMEVDTSDPWAGCGADSPVAMDTNVWQSAPTDTSVDQFWANFDAFQPAASDTGAGKVARSPATASSPPPFPVDFSNATFVHDSKPAVAESSPVLSSAEQPGTSPATVEPGTSPAECGESPCSSDARGRLSDQAVTGEPAENAAEPAEIESNPAATPLLSESQNPSTKHSATVTHGSASAPSPPPPDSALTAAD